MSETKTELLPCPFCGDQPELSPALLRMKPAWMVECHNESCFASTLARITDRDAIKAWNRRATAPSQPAEPDELARLEREIAERSTKTWINMVSNYEGYFNTLQELTKIETSRLRYLELRGLLEEHPTEPNLVRIKDHE